MRPGIAGTFRWAELATVPGPGLGFYAALFGWEPVDRWPAGYATETPFAYYMMRVGELSVVSIYPLLDEQREQGIPPHWLPYVAVERVEHATRRAVELGAKVLASPFPVRAIGDGTVAVIEDPTGARLALWQTGLRDGFQLSTTPGGVVWLELRTRALDEAAAFYGELFGWSRGSVTLGDGDYTMFLKDGERVGGAVEPAPELGDVGSHWAPFFSVVDCAASSRRVQELGGHVRLAPRDAAGLGTFAALEDPFGASFGLLQLG